MSTEGCCRFEGDLVAYLDGELDREASRELERHVADCARCARELDGFRSARDVLKAVPRLKVTESSRGSLIDRLAALPAPAPAREPRSRSPFRKLVYYAPSVAACAAFLVFANFWVLAAPGSRDGGVAVSGRAAIRRKMLLEAPADAIFERMIAGSELDVSGWFADGALYLRGYDDVYSVDRCIFAFLPAEWGAELDKTGGVKVVVENGRFHVPEDMRANYLDGSKKVTVVRPPRLSHSEIWNSKRLMRFLSTPQHIDVRAGSSS